MSDAVAIISQHLNADPLPPSRHVPELSAALDFVQKGYDADLGTVRMGVRDFDPLLAEEIVL